MRRTIAAVGLLGLGIMGTTLPAVATPDNGHGNNVSICHETGSEKNPVVEIDVNENALNGHGPGVNNGQGGGSGVNNGQGGHDDDDCYEEPGGNVEPNVPPVAGPPEEEPPADSQPVVAPPEVAPPLVAPPVVAPPAVKPEAPAAPVVRPVAKPAVKPVAKPMANPAAAALAAAPAAALAAAAPVAAMPVAAPASNAGYNVQTAAGQDSGTGIPSWLAMLTGALAGLSGLVLLRGGMRARKLEG